MNSQVWQNNSEISQYFSNCHDLQQVISKVEEDSWAEGRVICEIHVNGMKLSEEDEIRFAESPLAEINQLMVTTNTVDSVLQTTIDSVSKWLPVGREGSLKVADLIRLGQEVEAQQLFLSLIDSCLSINDSLHLLKALKAKELEARQLMALWEDCEENYKVKINELLDAFERQDMILVADILEYELSECIGDWDKLVALSFLNP